MNFRVTAAEAAAALRAAAAVKDNRTAPVIIIRRMSYQPEARCGDTVSDRDSPH
ncbi:hypothetical protein GCM10009678_94830 [Actinomadura kijaniata]